MQMVIGCGRGISGMAKNHFKTNIVGWQCAVKCFFKPHATSGTTKTVVPKNSENSGPTPTTCLDKAVLAQGGGGVPTKTAHRTPENLSCKHTTCLLGVFITIANNSQGFWVVLVLS